MGCQRSYGHTPQQIYVLPSLPFSLSHSGVTCSTLAFQQGRVQLASECHINRIICDWPSTSPVYAASVLFTEQLLCMRFSTPKTAVVGEPYGASDQTQASCMQSLHSSPWVVFLAAVYLVHFNLIRRNCCCALFFRRSLLWKGCSGERGQVTAAGERC